MNQAAIEKSIDILRKNDRGTYTVPTHGLYPFQWNWDSCLVALGFSHFDESRAWIEIETLFAHQWLDGMVPHIIFHEHDDGYFPGPDVWNTGRPTPTSGITQPPVAGFATQQLFERTKDREGAARRALALLPKITAWHNWFYVNRDPKNTGLVALLHPWESGRDNSVDWDDAFERVPTDGVEAFTRRDTQHANPDHRPTKAQYERYIWLLQKFRSMGWDNSKLHDVSPFQVVDPGFNAILIRSCLETAKLADALGETAIADENRAMAERTLVALETLWSDAHDQYLCYDRVIGKRINSKSIGGLIAAFAPIPAERTKVIAACITELSEHCEFLVPSHDPRAPEFDDLRYWRGPAWLVVNFLIADGLCNAGEDALSDRIISDSVKLIEKSGFAEYYSPISGKPCGGGRFTWTAAMVIEFLKTSK